MKRVWPGAALFLAIAAVAVWTWARPSAPAPPREAAAFAPEEAPRGAAEFAAACASCHSAGAAMTRDARGGALWEDDPRHALKIVLDGLQPPAGASGPFMPAFAETLHDHDIAELAAYMRGRFTDRPPWPDLEAAVRRARKAGA